MFWLQQLSALVLAAGLPCAQVTAALAQDGAKVPPPKATVYAASPETPAQLAERKRALEEMLQRLTTTGRIMQVVAHPDDEDGAMLTLESRVKGNSAMLFTFTRGEGGQNAQGAVFFDELGILRTLELLAADKEYGAEERFSHVADFGFSKSADETFRKWGGEDVPLKDLVEAVRDFQPDVLVARFSGTPKDGHGHHQASALMTVQAFHEAANARRFRTDDLRPWQPLKLYTGIAGDDATLVPDEQQPSALLDGKTPDQIALEGLRHQESQGLANVDRRGPRPKIYSSYKLAQTEKGVEKREHEADFFEGIDTSLPGLARRFPEEADTIPGLKQKLLEVEHLFVQARQSSQVSPEDAVAALSKALELLRSTNVSLAGGPLAKRIVEKENQCSRALMLAAHVTASFTLVTQNPKHPFVVPGQDIHLQAVFCNLDRHEVRFGTEPAPFSGGAFDPKPLAGLLPRTIGKGECVRDDFWRTVGLRSGRIHSEITKAPFYRNDPARDAVYQIAPEVKYPERLEPLAVAHIEERAPLVINGAHVDIGGIQAETESHLPVLIAPPVSVSMAPEALVRRLNQPHDAPMVVTVQNNGEWELNGTVVLNLSEGWTSEPAKAAVSVAAGDTKGVSFSVHWPAKASASRAQVKASFNTESKFYDESYHLLARADLPDAFPFYAPAKTRVSLISADIAERHNIGYIMGAGDTLPEDLRSLGFDVHLLGEADLATGDLAQYDAIMTGVRAYATRADLRGHNDRLLAYVKNGGTFVVQYEQDVNAFNSGHFTPYPATMGRDRVSQEEQPVTILDPAASVFHYPNLITEKDFDGWVQERGLYFMKEWSPEYTPLLSMNDVGEPPLKGGLLLAHYGKGIYIYSALSLYRELPNGVAGAARLLVNLLAAGHNPADSPVVNAKK